MSGETGAAIYMVGGPSGAGKDTLLIGAQEALKAQGISNVSFVKRLITRAPEQCTDLELPCTAEEIDAKKASGALAFYWEAHGGTKYAIPLAALDGDLAEKKRCVLNVSRSIVDDCISKYGGESCEVYFLNITASQEELTKRLIGRGRETPEQVAERVATAKQKEPHGPHVIHVVNEASKAEGSQMVVAALTGTLKYSLWLVPKPPFADFVTEQTEHLAKEFGSKPFGPHCTLCPSFVGTQRHALEKAAAVAAAIGGPVNAKFGEVSVSYENPFKACVLELDAEGPLKTATNAARDVLFAADDERRSTPYAPHISLLYGKYDTGLEKAGEYVTYVLPTSTEVEMTELVVTMSFGKAWHCWSEVGRFKLGP